MTTFAQYIDSCRVTENPRGEFIDDIQTLNRAGKFPDVQHWADLYRFVSSRTTSPETMNTARKLWRKYRMSLETAS